ncbi:DUF488 domain-containing protein [Metapseudomonas resinovorans]|uniref:DUF488 domain-containing protein n=1 Tax=Metapseudomonas resinovorans NBRC 106553 TaxID=1245471 RepID=S6AGR8_METRE|nr:DUF488 domain-containing protein [Pseudomonas resinovorans]BAN47345.1 hypothetical protein PCA10_16130 [Pseudomonas resinovorans NBRC 106553]
MIHFKRVFEAAQATDGRRVLVDRLWPRGCRKDALGLDAWLREVAPSEGLRKRFCHDPTLFAEFRLGYRAELAAHPEHWQMLLELARQGDLTLLYAAKDEHHNNARVLAEFLEEELDRCAPPSSPVCYAGEL